MALKLLVMPFMGTGLADPGPVAAALWTDTELQSSVCLDNIVTVVDAHNLRRQLTETRPLGAVNEAEQQIAYADVILLNKVPVENTLLQCCLSAICYVQEHEWTLQQMKFSQCCQVDLVTDPAQLAEVRHRIHTINAAAEVIQTQRSQVDLASILDRRAYREGCAIAEDAHVCSHPDAESCALCTEPSAASADTVTSQHGAVPHAEHVAANGRVQPDGALRHAHMHDSGIRTVALRESRRLDLGR